MMTEHGKDASQRVELRERIITAATEAFTSKGIKSITMDDIAAALGISKRTLYEVFSDKESLLKECILKAQADQGERSITCTSYYSLYFFNPNDFISYFLVPSTRFPLSCHSQFDIALF